MSENGYNGWTNYPTWAVALWIGNEQASSEQAAEMASSARKQAPYASQVADGIWTEEQATRYNLADSVKGWVVDWTPEEGGWNPDLGATMASDLLGYAFDQVNWQEIADSLLSE